MIFMCCSRKCYREPDTYTEFWASVVLSIIMIGLLFAIYYIENEADRILIYLITNKCTDEVTL